MLAPPGAAGARGLGARRRAADAAVERQPAPEAARGRGLGGRPRGGHRELLQHGEWRAARELAPALAAGRRRDPRVAGAGARPAAPGALSRDPRRRGARLLRRRRRRMGAPAHRALRRALHRPRLPGAAAARLGGRRPRLRQRSGGARSRSLGGARHRASTARREMLQAARRRARGVANVHLEEGDLERLPIADGACDAALLLLALTHVDEPARAVAEMARILKPGGRAVVVDLLRHDREEFRRQMGQMRSGFDRRRSRPSPRRGGLRRGPLLAPASGTGGAGARRCCSPAATGASHAAFHPNAGRKEAHHDRLDRQSARHRPRLPGGRPRASPSGAARRSASPSRRCPASWRCARSTPRSSPLEGQRIMGSLHMTIQTAVLIETLARARRRRALGLVQHLLDPGPRRRRRRRRPATGTPENPRGIPVFAYKGESLEEYWDFTARALDFGDGLGPDADRRRRRRRDAAHPQGRRVREGRRGARPDRPPTARSSPSSWRCSRSVQKEDPKRWQPRSRRRSTASPRRRPPASTASTRWRRPARCSSRRSTSTTRSPSRSSTTSTAAATRSSTASCAPPTSCSPARSPSSAATATSARAAPSRCAARARASSSPRSTRSARCRRRWRATR